MEKKVKRRTKIPTDSRILSKEDEKSPLVERIKRKRAAMSSEDGDKVVNKRRKVMMEDKNKIKIIPLDEDEDDVTVMDVYLKIKRMRSSMLRRRRRSMCVGTREVEEEEESSEEDDIISMSSSSPVEKRELENDFEELSEEDEEEEKKYICRSPVLIKGYSDYVDLSKIGFVDSDLEEESEEESDEDLVPESDRVEVDWGAEFVLRKRWRTITNPTVPRKIYYKLDDSEFIVNVLRDPEYPLNKFSKFALNIYNAIQKTEYEYLGLVKAYMKCVGCFHYEVRFRARIKGEDAINFQASIYQGIRRRKRNIIPVEVEFVYPLPPC